MNGTIFQSKVNRTLGACALLMWLATSTQPTRAALVANESDGSDRFFAAQTIPHIRIQIAGTCVNLLRQNPRAYVSATIREGDRIFDNVGIHLKGAAGSFQPIDHETPAFTLNFDKFKNGQKFHDLDKVHLNNSVQDRSLLTEAICSRLFLEAGVPTPRSTHARVEFNGRDLGLYVLKEGFDRTFLRRHFKNADGNLYDGGFLQDVTQPLRKDSGPNDVNDRSDLKALVGAARDPDPVERIERLQKVVDLDRFLSFMALEMMTWHWDGYTMKKNNYRVFHDLDTGKFVFLPHGMDQMFWEPNGEVLPKRLDEGGLVARAVLSTPEGRRRYVARAASLLTNVFVAEKLTNHIRQLEERIRPELESINPALARQHDAEVRKVRNEVVQRVATVRQRLSEPEADALRFGPSGVIALTHWRMLDLRGTGKLDMQTDDNGLKTLHIASRSEGLCTASWRRRVLLAPGNYVFEGRVRTAGVVTLEQDTTKKGLGAGLRYSRASRTNSAVGDTAWQKLEHEFVLKEEGEVDLLCELRGDKGEAWFDLGSLKLRKR
jgi:hypothetical protein